MASAFGIPLAPSLCDHCGNATEGTIRCSVQENKNLCQDCFQILPNAKREDIGDPEWVCDIHSDQRVEIFCKTCKVGCCKECAEDIHQGHEVVNAFELEEEIRRDLTEQLQEVGERAEKLSHLRQMIESSIVKIEEAPKSVDKVVDEIKEEIARDLQKEVDRINWELQNSIFYLHIISNNQLEVVKYGADYDIQRIEEITQDLKTHLLKDAEQKKCKIQQAEPNILVAKQACECANSEIKTLLESTPEKLVSRGRQLSSLVKASSSFECQNDVVSSCREAEADLPKVKVSKGDFSNGSGPFLSLVNFVLCLSVMLFFANKARGPFRDAYNCALSSESVICLISTLLFFPLYFQSKCFMFMLLHVYIMLLDYQFARKVSFMDTPKIFLKFLRVVFEFELYTVLLLILVSSPLYFFQLKTVDANFVSFISILQSCSFIFLSSVGMTFFPAYRYIAKILTILGSVPNDNDVINKNVILTHSAYLFTMYRATKDAFSSARA